MIHKSISIMYCEVSLFPSISISCKFIKVIGEDKRYHQNGNNKYIQTIKINSNLQIIFIIFKKKTKRPTNYVVSNGPAQLGGRAQLENLSLT